MSATVAVAELDGDEIVYLGEKGRGRGKLTDVDFHETRLLQCRLRPTR